MEWLSTSWGYYGSGVGTIKDMIEQANEELQILESEHPNRFSYLKVELKSFISHLESQSLLLSATAAQNVVPNSINKVVVPSMGCSPVPVASSVSTQESSAGKKRKKVRPTNGTAMESKNVDSRKQKAQKISCIKNRDDGGNSRKERIDAVLERARTCLHKIQQLKTSFS